MLEGERALAKVVQYKSRKRDGVPGYGNILSSEMSHVGVKCLRSGHGQHDRSENHFGVHRVTEQQFDSVPWIQRGKNSGIIDDVANSDEANHYKPDQHHRAKDAADILGAFVLKVKKAAKNDTGDDRHGFRIFSRKTLQTFHRTQNRNCWRDDAVTIKQRGPKQYSQGKNANARALAAISVGQGQQSENTAFAAIVG